MITDKQQATGKLRTMASKTFKSMTDHSLCICIWKSNQIIYNTGKLQNNYDKIRVTNSYIV